MEIPWIHRDHVHQPFDDRTWHHLRTTLTHRSPSPEHGKPTSPTPWTTSNAALNPEAPPH
ncbi:hypothetical protein AB0442_38435 [Kitasatospora sp. NPDC085895]|uniref:hypothetical protein n=1 Tax=Kitasatospora sp. NPDC085895 TaxID=3155057 RepID=UPI00344FF013